MPKILDDVGWILGVVVGLAGPYVASVLKGSAFWYGAPTLYFLAFFALRAELSNKEVDFPAAICFGVLITVCGWGAAKYERRRW